MTGETMVDQLERAAELGAEKAVAKMMLILGVDITDKDDMKALRADLLNARKVRLAGDKIGGMALIIIVSALAAGALGFLWSGFQAAIGKN